MDQKKISELIKKIRKDNNLTQKDLADKYNVTYQAVSKWETGKNIPDISILKQMSNDFNISIDDILEGEYSKKNTSKKLIILGVCLALVAAILFFVFKSENDFKFRTIESNCSNFNITGSIAYNDSKSSIYISNIDYCGGEDKQVYSSFDCKLYEKKGSVMNLIESYSYAKASTLKEFLSSLTFSIDNYSKICKKNDEPNLVLEIEAHLEEHKSTRYEVPLKLESTCKK